MLEDRLVRAVRRGDAEAATELYQRHRGAVHRCALAILGRQQDAEDVVQVTMLRAFEALRTSPPKRLEPWLVAVARNESLDVLRRRREHPGLPPELAGVPAVHETAALRAEARRVLEDLAALPDRQRAALVLRELHQLSYREIGSALGVQPGTARQAVLQARRSLAERADGRGQACASIRVLLDTGDRRRSRAIGVQAHLEACVRCAEVAGGRMRGILAGPWLAPLLTRFGGGNTGASRVAVGFATAVAIVGTFGPAQLRPWAGEDKPSTALAAAPPMAGLGVSGTGRDLVSNGATAGDGIVRRTRGGTHGRPVFDSGASAGSPLDAALGAGADSGADGEQRPGGRAPKPPKEPKRHFAVETWTGAGVYSDNQSLPGGNYRIDPNPENLIATARQVGSDVTEWFHETIDGIGDIDPPSPPSVPPPAPY